MPLPSAFTATPPAISGVSGGPGPASVGAGQGWVWVVGTDGPQLVRGNGTALGAYSLYGPALPRRGRAGGVDGRWAGAAGQPAGRGKEWAGVMADLKREELGEGAGGMGVGGRGLRLMSPSAPTASSLRGEMVAKLRGLSGRFEVARGGPVNLLLRQNLRAEAEAEAEEDRVEAEARMEDEEEGEECGAGGAWQAAAMPEREVEGPPGDGWLEEHNAADRELVGHVAALLACAAEGGDQEEAGAGTGKSPFHAQRRPKVGLGEYCERIVKYGGCSPGCLALAVVYVDRYLARAEGERVCSLNVHRLLLAAVLLAAKQWEDAHYSNAFWAKVGGVGAGELNSLEKHMLGGLRWRLHVDKPEFDRYRAALLRWPAAPEAAADRLAAGARGGEGGWSSVLALAEAGLEASKGRAAAVAPRREEAPTPQANGEVSAAAAAAASPAIAA